VWLADGGLVSQAAAKALTRQKLLNHSASAYKISAMKAGSTAAAQKASILIFFSSENTNIRQ
jgi:hypothetical protein